MEASVWSVVFGVFLVVAGATHGPSDEDMPVDSEENMTEMLVREQQLHGVVDNHLLKMALSSLLNNLQRRTNKYPSVLHYPQRFGRGSHSDLHTGERIHSQDLDDVPQQIWSLAVPQRFGKK
ncbi:pro-FMRFamide-related neuropeptide FF like [Neoarius graeffei]|uniref:pro-FMRFamide-related neuropeptide FF like n=1 Tax=Neoarius graeffei TaxID=443677 RepID=UPI00298D40E2|nr:pro-FMRFamide-related neuropeptide FF like [Neoarius graeffei]